MSTQDPAFIYLDWVTQQKVPVACVSPLHATPASHGRQDCDFVVRLKINGYLGDDLSVSGEATGGEQSGGRCENLRVQDLREVGGVHLHGLVSYDLGNRAKQPDADHQAFGDGPATAVDESGAASMDPDGLNPASGLPRFTNFSVTITSNGPGTPSVSDRSRLRPRRR